MNCLALGWPDCVNGDPLLITTPTGSNKVSQNPPIFWPRDPWNLFNFETKTLFRNTKNMGGQKNRLTNWRLVFCSEKCVFGGENLLSIGWSLEGTIPLESACPTGGVINKGFTLACLPLKMSLNLDLRATMVGTSSLKKVYTAYIYILCIMFLPNGDLGRQKIHKNH